jgi:hypothetical protein
MSLPEWSIIRDSSLMVGTHKQNLLIMAVKSFKGLYWCNSYISLSLPYVFSVYEVRYDIDN